MKVWLELTQEEGESLFDTVKGFTIDRMKTAVAIAPKDEPDKEAVVEDKAETAPKEEPTKTEDISSVTLEIVRAVLTEKKRSGKDLKALFGKFRASKLSEVAPKDYASLLKEAEAL